MKYLLGTRGKKRKRCRKVSVVHAYRRSLVNRCTNCRVANGEVRSKEGVTHPSLLWRPAKESTMAGPGKCCRRRPISTGERQRIEPSHVTGDPACHGLDFQFPSRIRQLKQQHPEQHGGVGKQEQNAAPKKAPTLDLRLPTEHHLLATPVVRKCAGYSEQKPWA